MARKPDSITHTEERRAKMQAESDEQKMEREEAEAERKDKQAVRDREAKEEQVEFLTKQASLVQAGDTRDHLLERIRAMRDEKPYEPPPPPPLSDFHREQLRLEQEAGAAGVKRAEAEVERNREIQRRAAEEQAKREGVMEVVRHPNPGQKEQFPAQNATLGKKK
jgi:hypothetical protein